jgi:transcriptional regulator with XRE-family HTH domain
VQWERLGALVRRDRIRLGMRTQGDLAARAGVSKRTVSDVERAARPNISADTLGAIEAALGWEPGSAVAILQGLDPLRAGDELLARIAAVWPTLGDRERQIVAAVVDILAAP